jgi:hypothetical protein
MFHEPDSLEQPVILSEAKNLSSTRNHQLQRFFASLRMTVVNARLKTLDFRLLTLDS